VSEPRRLEGGELEALFDQGLALHQAGRIDEARRLYEAALGTWPEHFAALHMLGVSFIQTGQLDRAVELIGHAIRLRPDVADAHGNLANALNSLGRHEEAIESCDRAIALNPDHAEAHGNRGGALYRLGRPGEALDSYARQVALRPGDARAHFNQAIMLRELGRRDEALAGFDRAAALKPAYVEAHRNRGLTLYDLGRFDDALASYDRVIALRPDYAEAYANQGAALQGLRRPEAALESSERAIALKPDYAEAHYNRGSALYALRRLEEAIASFDRAIALKPAFAEAWDSRAVAQSELGRWDEALAGLDRALALKPDYAEAHHNMAMCRLALGDYAAGWAHYEWRWKTRQLGRQARGLAAPLWLGQEDIRGRTILLHAEQGLGDTLQFCRYASLVAALGARVVLEVQPGLKRLLSRLEGVEAIIGRGEALPPHDLQTPLMSLPLALGAGPDGGRGAYLAADPDEAAAWRARLGGSGKLRVGLCWAGGLRPDQPAADAMDQRRSLPLAAFAPLGEIPGLEVYSLQKGPPAGQLGQALASRWGGPPIIDLTHELKDFADTAALVANLDLVITCDTAMAHLAGAMGRPVWILNRFDACWRWLEGRDDSPWYSSARLFRQAAPGDWRAVVESVKRALVEMASAKA